MEMNRNILPLVSVVMPVYNTDKFLHEAITSILEQSYHNLELIIVDDFSTDTSRDVINSFHDTRIRIFQNKKNAGFATSRNIGIQAARGDFIALMDSDDISHNTRIAKQVKFLLNNSGIDVVGTWLKRFGLIRSKIQTPKHNEDIRAAMLFRMSVCHATLLWRKRVFIDYDLFYPNNLKTAEDYWLCATAVTKGIKFETIPDYLYSWRAWKGSNTMTTGVNIAQTDRRKVYAIMLNKLIQNVSESEIAFHSHIAEFTLPISETNINDVFLWLSRLQKLNIEQGLFPSPIFDKVLGQYFFSHCLSFSRINHRLARRYWESSPWKSNYQPSFFQHIIYTVKTL